MRKLFYFTFFINNLGLSLSIFMSVFLTLMFDQSFSIESLPVGAGDWEGSSGRDNAILLPLENLI